MKVDMKEVAKAVTPKINPVKGVMMAGANPFFAPFATWGMVNWMREKMQKVIVKDEVNE